MPNDTNFKQLNHTILPNNCAHGDPALLLGSIEYIYTGAGDGKFK